MTTIRKIALSISALGVFGLAVVLVASAVGSIASADHDDGEGHATSFIGLWQTIQSNSDGALQTLSISDTNLDGEFQIALHESFLSLCGGQFGVVSGTAAVDADGILVGDLTIVCENGDVISDIHPAWDYIKGHDQLVGLSGDVYHRTSSVADVKADENGDAVGEGEWNEALELVVEVEVDSEVGFFEIGYEEIVGREDETERILEVCFPFGEGFICEDIELGEEDGTLDFKFPRGVSTASIESVETPCGVVDIDIVIPLGGYEKRKSTEYSAGHKPLIISNAVEISAEDTEIGVGITGTICDVDLASIVVFEASASMIREELKERELD